MRKAALALAVTVVLPLQAEDMRTTKSFFRDATITRWDETGVTIRHEGGISKVPYSVLPEDLRKQYEGRPVPTPTPEPSIVELRDARVTEWDAQGVTIAHDEGITRVPYWALQPSLRKQYEGKPPGRISAAMKAAIAGATGAVILVAASALKPPPRAPVEPSATPIVTERELRAAAARVREFSEPTPTPFRARVYATPVPSRARAYATPVPSSGGGPIWVDGYRRKDGTYVRGHYRSR